MKTLGFALLWIAALLFVTLFVADYVSLDYRVRQLELAQPCPCGMDCPCLPGKAKPLVKPRRRPDGKLGDLAPGDE